MAQLAIKNLLKLASFARGPWNLPHKFHLYLINKDHHKQKSFLLSLKNKATFPAMAMTLWIFHWKKCKNWRNFVGFQELFLFYNKNKRLASLNLNGTYHGEPRTKPLSVLSLDKWLYRDGCIVGCRGVWQLRVLVKVVSCTSLVTVGPT